MFKVVDKDEPDSTTTMTDAVVNTFTKMMNLSAAISSLKKTGELREYTKKEELQLANMTEAMHKVVGTRNHIITELVRLTKNAGPVFKKASEDELDMNFIKSSIDFLTLLVQFNESN
jgi:citrate synthase